MRCSMSRPDLLLIALTLALLSCCPATDPATLPQNKKVSPAPLTPKDAVRYLLRHHDIPLSVHPSCANVGTERTDKTLGDYFSGFLAELTSGKNTVNAKCELEPGTTPARWNCKVLIRHSEGDDEWAWGVDYSMRVSDKALIKASIRCTGAG